VQPPPVGPAPVGPQPPAPKPVPPRPDDPGPKVRTLYQFVPSAEACRACKNHAAHRVYDSTASITPNRAHVGMPVRDLPS
jgi:hypothetical protein